MFFFFFCSDRGDNNIIIKNNMILPVDGSETDKNAATKNWVSNKTNLKGDWLNFFLLLLLYTLQGFPLGLTSAIPILLQSKEDMSYQNQVKSIGCFFFFTFPIGFSENVFANLLCGVAFFRLYSV